MDRNGIHSGTQARRTPYRAWLTALCTLFSLSTGHAAVDIDQQPLTTRSVLAPNIVMMLDDSGSMQWVVMPDQPAGVGDVDDGARDDELINAAINGVYYDPDITYLPPYTATAQPEAVTPITTRYPNAAFEAAWYDGFDPSPTNLINIATYKFPSRTGSSNCDNTHSDGPTEICGRTPRGSHTFRSGTQSNNYKYRSLFVYRDSNNVLRYVGAATASTGNGSDSEPLAGTCADITSGTVRNQQTGVTFNGGINPSHCDDSAAARQNVANWFSYYRKRIYMAKSGLMNAFAPMDSAVRFGFGSINGGYRNSNDNDNNLPDDSTTPTIGDKPAIARVKPFGSGANGTQKLAFWDWLERAETDGSTPLRKALKAVGEYYKSEAQPWQSGASENAAAPAEELACRQSYSILMTDGFWNGPDPGGIGDADNPGSRVRRDGPNAQCFEYPNRSSGSTCDAPPASKPFADSDSVTLADVAMYYWLNDLRPNTTNEVPASAEDPAFWQHMSTFTVGLFGQDASLPGLGTRTAEQIAGWAISGGAPNNFNWPEPGSGSTNNISDLVHAGINGRGGFYSAGNPEAFEEGLRDALRRVQDRVGTGASLAANSTRLDTGTTTYQSLYYSSNWKGDLKALPVNADTGAIENQNVDWLASEEMPDWDDRSIKTCATCPATPALVDLTWANASTAQKSALGNSQTEQTNVINWLRGQPNNESPNGAPSLRRRQRPSDNPNAGVLGDIVSSQPVFVGAPNPNLYSGKTFPGAGSYSSFASNQASRAARLWVAANDGMVHAFDTATGAETFAYLPNAVIFPHTVDGVAYRGLESLSNTNYGGGAIPHQYFNDGELTVADAYFGGGWKTVMVGTTGRGPARAVYALDVTNPAAPTLLWERAAGDGQTNADWIGQILGKPVIAMVGDAANPSWAVLMGNGYNSVQGRSALLQFDLVTGALTVHTTDGTGSNGLAQPVVWIDDPDNSVGTVAYAGDLSGKVWSFNLTGGAALGTHLFTTQNAGGGAQPITAGMLAGKDPDTQKVWIFFGTGRFLEANDLGNTGLQTWYGLIVQGTGAVTNATLRSGLTQRDITGEIAPDPDADPPELGARTVEDSVAGDMAGKAGWFMDLKLSGTAGRGERMVTPNQFQGSLLLGTTRIPGTGSDKCNPSGDGWIMAINPFTGAAPTDIFFDLNGDGEFDEDDMIGDPPKPAAGVGFTSIPNNPIFVGNVMLVSFDNATNASIATAGGGGAPERMSWRELVDQ